MSDPTYSYCPASERGIYFGALSVPCRAKFCMDGIEFEGYGRRLPVPCETCQGTGRLYVEICERCSLALESGPYDLGTCQGHEED